jgi:hypothetical protein
MDAMAAVTLQTFKVMFEWNSNQPLFDLPNLSASY